MVEPSRLTGESVKIFTSVGRCHFVCTGAGGSCSVASLEGGGIQIRTLPSFLLANESFISEYLGMEQPIDKKLAKAINFAMDPTACKSPASVYAQVGSMRNLLPEGTVVLVQVGDFYEAFGEDALRVSRALGTTLTKRNEIPMTGFAYYALHDYLRDLKYLDFGVAVLAQPEKGSAKRVLSHFTPAGA